MKSLRCANFCLPGVPTLTPGRSIKLRGVRVHNLKGIDLDIPHRQLVVLCGLSGSGKTSLAFDTLYAEGQRRYIESFSAYTRQFLERLEKPAAERIDGIPPAIAVTHKNTTRAGRSTVGTATETSDYLRLLFAKIGQVVCRGCGQVVRQEQRRKRRRRRCSASRGDAVPGRLHRQIDAAGDWRPALADLRDDGFVRIVAGGRTIDLTSTARDRRDAERCRLRGRRSPLGRRRARSACATRSRRRLPRARAAPSCSWKLRADAAADGIEMIDGRPFRRHAYSNRFRCDACDLEYPAPEPRLFSFNSPLGACPECEGFGNVIDVDMDLVVPDRGEDRSAKGPSRPGTRRPTRTSWKSCSPWRPTTACRVDVPFAS